jgi:hypothetical protein
VPAGSTVSCTGATEEVNVAVTDAAAFKDKVQAAVVPLQAPDHPVNFEPDVGVAVSFTDVPLGKLALHVNPQLMPVRLLLIVPAPVPALCTVSGTRGLVELNVAVADALAAKLTVHAVDVPLQAPDHPANAEPDAGAAVRVKDVPPGKM